jgi:hypothetical protein
MVVFIVCMKAAARLRGATSPKIVARAWEVTANAFATIAIAP